MTNFPGPTLFQMEFSLYDIGTKLMGFVILKTKPSNSYNGGFVQMISLLKGVIFLFYVSFLGEYFLIGCVWATHLKNKSNWRILDNK